MTLSRAAQSERTRLLRAQAVKAETKNLVEAGELVSAAEVKSEWLSASIQIRTRLLQIPSRIAARYPDPKLKAALEREIADALHELADS